MLVSLIGDRVCTNSSSPSSFRDFSSNYLLLQLGKLLDRIKKLVTLILFFFIIGVLESYHTMDILVSLNFKLVITIIIRDRKVTNKKKSANYAVKIGLFTGAYYYLNFFVLGYKINYL